MQVLDTFNADLGNGLDLRWEEDGLVRDLLIYPGKDRDLKTDVARWIALGFDAEEIAALAVAASGKGVCHVARFTDYQKNDPADGAPSAEIFKNGELTAAHRYRHEQRTGSLDAAELAARRQAWKDRHDVLAMIMEGPGEAPALSIIPNEDEDGNEGVALRWEEPDVPWAEDGATFPVHIDFEADDAEALEAEIGQLAAAGLTGEQIATVLPAILPGRVRVDRYRNDQACNGDNDEPSVEVFENGALTQASWYQGGDWQKDCDKADLPALDQAVAARRKAVADELRAWRAKETSPERTRRALAAGLPRPVPYPGRLKVRRKPTR